MLAGVLGILVCAIALTAVVAQSNPGRFVCLQALQGSILMSIVLVATPLALGSVAALVVRDRVRLSSVTWVAAAAVGLVMCCGSPIMSKIDEDQDHDVSVIGVAPDGAFEVTVARRDGDSGDYLILRSRSRAGLFSRYASTPLATLCNSYPSRVDFDGSVIVVHTDGAFEGTVSLSPDTLEPVGQLTDCVGDQ